MALTIQEQRKAWWKESVVYQIYPASFLDSGAGDTPGWGDVPGITSKLDYLKDLGVDVVWTSPIYKSPQVDMGYDISDYRDIDPKYGTLADVDELIKQLKKRDMKLMMDLVVNHTSDQHAWFLDSRSSKTSKYRDWYIWKPAKYDDQGKRQPPNNWLMILGEANSAWTWDEETQEYYLSLFTAEQPDLNWENVDVRKAVHEVLKFWLDRGASGFRMDVINLISKDQRFPDAEVIDPEKKYQSGHKYFANGPRLHEFLREMHDEVLSKYDTITVGEMPFVTDEDEILKAVGQDAKELNMIFIFELVDISNVPGQGRLSLHPWTPKDFRDIVVKWQTVMQKRGGWNSVFLENHDNPRSISHWTDDSDQNRDLCAKLLSMMNTTLCGTLYVYQGEEIGMRNFPASWAPEEYQDVDTQNYWKAMNDAYPNDKAKLAYARKVMQTKARDHARTPVQWTAGPHAGFCKEGAKPWMRVNDDYTTYNVEAQLAEGDGGSKGDVSVLAFWRRGLKNRKEHADVFVYGEFTLLSEEEDGGTVFAYRRTSEKEAFVTVLNLSGKSVEWKVPAGAKVEKWVAGNHEDREGGLEKGVEGVVKLEAWEALLGVARV
ncbi:glycoside hydrolase family 13 protein [Zymoseptoria brevis]|uniref:Glycoside hydrolase family 13 protein n=1 Tax=Zymoseptoria brevis TaxID=1047168 RepID=A0A0F4GU04_9PEZI|nr:glycoside hydrolase family 13 protein [Zymoseptoria brevis]